MAIASVAHSFAQKQDAFKEEGLNNTRTSVSPFDIERNLALEFARQCVLEYADEMDEGYYLRAKDLPDAEKKILLCYAVDCMELYEDFIQNPTRLQAAYREYEKEMQYWIDEVIDDVYQDYVTERKFDCGYQRERHEDNGEVYWISRN
jgi:hypothetical protein